MESDKNMPVPWPGWKIVRRLGSGGFGSVYEIERDFYGDRERAAMKVVKLPQNPSDLENDYTSGMTEEEIREKYTCIQRYMVEEYRQMLEYKGHSNIVNCHDFSVIQNPNQPGCTIYIRMELLTPLRDVLEKEKLSEARIIQVGTDICQALEICQQKDLIHRDIKPDNIMMSEFGIFKLGDFGVARTMEKTMSASMAGTDWYMAPEVAKKMKYGKSVDTYSLGLVLYWLLNYYRLPFVPMKDRITAKDMEQAYRLRMQGKAISEPAEGSPGLKAIVLKSLAFDREGRYHSAREMREALLSIGKPEMNSAQSNPVPGNQAQSKWQETADANGAFGIYFDTEEIHVRLWIGNETRPILKMPAVYTLDDLDDILAGNRALNYQKCRKEKNLYSVLESMKKAENCESAAVKESQKEKCCALMKELKKVLDKTPYGRIRDCVITVPVSSLNIQKSVYKAMEEAGFRVIRQLSTAVACAVSKAYMMTPNQYFMVHTAADGEHQYVTALYEDDVLEILENNIGLHGEERMDINRSLLTFHAGDKTFCRQYRDYEELSAIAADGAAIQGARIKGFIRNFLLLDSFPWKAGIEIVDERKNVCFPLTWMTEERSSLPKKSAPVSIRLDSGIRGKALRLYIGQEEFNEGDGSVRMLGEWALEKIYNGFGSEPKQLEAVLWLNTDIQSIRIELKNPGMDGNIKSIDFLNDDAGRNSRVSLTATFVPGQILQEVSNASEKFRIKAGMPEDWEMNSAIAQGIQMIARQSTEVFESYGRAGADVRIDTFIEQMLAIADNLEYGLKEAERMQCREEKKLLLYFYKMIRINLLKLNVLPIEAEGTRFDPYIHHAMDVEWTDGVESDMITEEIQKGYVRGEKLLRPAKVKVAK